MAIALPILKQLMSKGLAPIGSNIPIEVVQVNIEGVTEADVADSAVILQKGDRLGLIVQAHAKQVSENPDQETSSLGFILARRNECLVPFSTDPHDQSQVTGYRTTTPAAYLASLYYNLRGGFLLLGHGSVDVNGESPKASILRSEESEKARSKTIPRSSYSMFYLLLDSRWCKWFKVYEGIALASDLPQTLTPGINAPLVRVGGPYKGQ